MSHFTLVIIGLIASLLLSTLLVGLLALNAVAVPDILPTLAVGSLTALAGVLATNRSEPRA